MVERTRPSTRFLAAAPSTRHLLSASCSRGHRGAVSNRAVDSHRLSEPRDAASGIRPLADVPRKCHRAFPLHKNAAHRRACEPMPAPRAPRPLRPRRQPVAAASQMQAFAGPPFAGSGEF